MKKLTVRQLCRAGVVCALYVLLTVALGQFSFGVFQIRPAEALCLLPLFFPETVPALFLGCALSNLASPFFLYDVVFGSLTTLVASVCTYFCGKLKSTPLKIFLGGLFPVLLNAAIIPLILLYAGGGNEASIVSYFAYAGSIFLTEAVWVYGLGFPLSLWLEKIKNKSDLSD